MKSLRLLLALTFASLLVTAVHAGDDKDKSKDKPEAACACGKDKDGKECGKDKECCCKEKEGKKEEAKK